jgi:CHAT domain-containing protein
MKHLLFKNMKLLLAVFIALLSFFCQAQENQFNIKELQDKIIQFEKLKDIQNKEYTDCLHQLALIYQNQGNFYQAEPLFLQIIEIKKKVFGEKNIEYASSLNDLAALHYYQGKYSDGEQLCLKAVKIRKEVLGKNSIEYLISLNNLAATYNKQHKNKEAESLYLEIIEIEKANLGDNKPDSSYAIHLNNLALLYDDEGRYEESEKLFQEVLNIKKEINGEKNISYTITLKNLALSYRSQGKYKEAESLFLKSLDIKKEVLGEIHPSYILNILNLAVFYRLIDSNEKASIYFENFSLANKNRMNLDIFNLTERELINYLDLKKFILFSPLSFLSDVSTQYPNNNIAFFDNELLFKNLSLRNNDKLKKVIQKSDNKNLQTKYFNFLKNKKEIIKIQELQIDKRPNYYESLVYETEKLEKDLSIESIDFSNSKKEIEFNFKNIKDKIYKDELLIDLVCFNYGNKKGLTDIIKYGAFIIKKDYKFPKFFTLFEIKQLDFLLSKKIGQQDSIRIDKQYTNKSISDLFLSPLEEELQGITTIYFSSTGLGNQIDFAALPISENQTFGEKYKLHILSSPSDLVEYNATTLDKKSNIEFLLYGGIDYNKSVPKVNIDKEREVVADLEDNIELRNGSGISGFDYIDGTNKEVNQIEIKGNKNGFTTSIFNESKATKESILQLDGRSRPFVLHLATHGFFFETPLKKEIANEIKSIEGKAKIYKASEDPMMRSGLVFAGVNNYWSKTNDDISIDNGILTASEISNLDLSACQLVVLSACETGLGEVKGSEGVFGLQRAFKMAGVKNIIMSLWKVPDTQTAELFDVFYSECFAGKTIHEAFQSAQAKMKAKYSPYYWAGFVLLE